MVTDGSTDAKPKEVTLYVDLVLLIVDLGWSKSTTWMVLVD